MSILRLFGRASFSHGIHPPAHKGETAHIPVRRLPFPPRLILPLSQHIGAPAQAIVSKGEEVVRGQPIATAGGAVSVPVHAPATGRIKGIERITTARGTKEPAILLDVFEASTQEVLW
ncbi:MAG TPA: electron transport complex subunit RsxC, partial [Thiolapillus brandeum]|nr:electron transport complex subunit RsxC [Thiolapillus brandeum]